MVEYIECYTCNPTRCEGCNIHILAKMLHAGKLDRLMDDHHTIIETADVAPVVHGRWEKDPDMRRMDGHIYDYRCSRCHSSAEKGCYNNYDRLTKYCPNCGARMDGDA